MYIIKCMQQPSFAVSGASTLSYFELNGKCDTGTGRGHVASRRLLEASSTIDVCTLNARSYAADTSAVAFGDK